MVRPLPCHRTSFSEPQAALLGTIATPQDFLKAIVRSSETKLTPESWEQLFHTNGHQLRKAGLTVEDRRYVPVCSYMAGGVERARDANTRPTSSHYAQVHSLECRKVPSRT